MKKSILTLAVAALCCSAGFAQSRSAVKINEVMVENANNVVDEYGNRSGWVELFNSNFAPVNISSVFLSTDKANPKMYPVPLGDERTHMGKRQHVVFFADGMPNRGTFHTSFEFTPGQPNTVYLFDADGITLIDSVTVPATVLADQSYARMDDGSWQVRTDGATDYITPGGANTIVNDKGRVKEFAEKDKNGLSMTVIAMAIVFGALLVLCLCFYGLGKLGSALSRQRKREAQGQTREEVKIRDVQHDSGEEIAAIVAALNEHFNAHDTENTILTINKVKRAYSPWSSKIYNLRQVPEVHRGR